MNLCLLGLRSINGCWIQIHFIELICAGQQKAFVIGFPDRLKSNFLSHQNSPPLSFRQFKSMALLKSKHCPYFLWAGGLTSYRQRSAHPSTTAACADSGTLGVDKVFVH